ncbi:MAG: IclR family transcriptional regulator, partial [Proteobacteria bacterium]|nr:IclR family transcriptional regulator [Pseudomonadota bacterium]
VESNFPLRAELQPGSHVPIHCTGLGKLFLAYLPTRTRKRVIDRIELVGYTANTIITAEALEADCRRIRERGYAVNDQEFHDGIISLAVPMAPDGSHVVAGLALHAPAARMDVTAARKHIPTLKKYADQFAADLSIESEPT